MTLALYGKSRRRQGTLLFLGVFAVFIAALAGFALMRDSANALTLDSAAGTWTSSSGSGSSCTPTYNGAEVRWGNGSGDGCGLQSGYRWDGGPSVTFSPGASFLLGKFTHFNNPISGYSPDTVTLSLPLVFSDPPQNVNLSLVFEHDETPNQANPCAYPTNQYPTADNSNGCADRVKLPNLASQQFQVGDNLYKLEFTGFRPLASNTACPTSDPGGTEVDKFYTKEAANNYACVYAKLTFTSPASMMNRPRPGSPCTKITAPARWAERVAAAAREEITSSGC